MSSALPAVHARGAYTVSVLQRWEVDGGTVARELASGSSALDNVPPIPA
jgi:hypothetical protein